MEEGRIVTIYYMSEQKQQAVKRSRFDKLKAWFIQLSFWKKIIIIFTLNTIILLILTDAIMLVLFQKISNDIIATSNSEKQQFNILSNDQIVSVSSRMILSRFDFYSNLIAQLASSYTFFSQNPSLFTSLQSVDPPNPKLTSSFNETSYSEVGYYYYGNQSSFTPLPYIDELMPSLITEMFYTSRAKRMNVFVQSISDLNDLTARTFPATNTYTIPDSTAIYNRFEGIPQGNFSVSYPYIDILTTLSTKDTLIALRTIIRESSRNIMLEIEMPKASYENILNQLYYFPSAVAVMVSYDGSNFQFYSSTPPSYILENINTLYNIGNNRFAVRNGQDDESVSEYVSSTVGLASTYNLGGNSGISNSSTDPIRCIVVVDASQIEQPANDIQQFLATESNILTGIVLSWSFVILLSTVALATVVGNYIFFNLKMLSTKMDQYIKDPSKFHKIVIQLKELELKGILKRLSDNLIAIIQKIQVRKKERKDRINQNYHPLSVGEPKFQERQQLNDYEIIEQIKQQVKARVEQLKCEAAAKEKAQKEKEEIEAKLKEIIPTPKNKDE